MNDWIDLGALWKIVVIGLACGAGLPAVFAVGLKALARAEGDTVTDGGGGVSSASASASASTGTFLDSMTAGMKGSPVLFGAAVLCFAVVLAAIGAGIYLIVSAT